MQVSITETEWRAALDRARDVGGALGGKAGEGAAIVVARAAVEALGLTVPVLVDELDPPRQLAGSPGPAKRTAESLAGEVERPARDLRLAARIPTDVDGYCRHCDSVYGAQALAVMPDGNRLCPTHGTAVSDVTEVAEGRYRTGRPDAAPRGMVVTRERCGAPVGGHPCALDAGHDGRHDPRQQVSA